MAAILMNNPDFKISEKTLYNYVNNGYFEGINSIDLPRKVKYKPRKLPTKDPQNTQNRKNRTYEDYLAYMEKNHEFMRYVLPKGTSFDNLTQQDVNILMSNINSYPREELNKCCPFDLANMLIGKNIINKFGYHQIEKNDVILTPNLLKK